jgi:hypothetical protein
LHPKHHNKGAYTVKIINIKYLMIVMAAFTLLNMGVGVDDCSAKAYPVLHRGVRPLGMGGAFTPWRMMKMRFFITQPAYHR